MKNLAVGYFYNEPFADACAPWTHRIREVFYAWPEILSCRPAPEFSDAFRQRLNDDLAWCRSQGILLDTLFNCNCYGDIAISPDLSDLVIRTLNEMGERDLFPDIVTTTSPFIATFLRKRFPAVKIRASVNFRIHGTMGFEYVDELFDSFYISREHHREFPYVEHCAAWAKAHGKILGMQLNSGCIRQCPFQQFHDNLHGHNRIQQSKRGLDFNFEVFRCRTTYSRKKYEEFIRATWIRPEDAHLFAPYVSVMKLATRRIANPGKIVAAYASESYDGNLLELMDPIHADLFAPYIIDNKSFPKDWAMSGIGAACANDCAHCEKCGEILKQVMRKVPEA